MNTEPKRELSEVLAAIDGSGGITAELARRLKVDWQTAAGYVKRWKATRDAWTIEGNKSDELARSIVLDALVARDLSTAKWWLSRRLPNEFGANVGLAELQAQVDEFAELLNNGE